MWVTFNDGSVTVAVDAPERSGLGTSSARTVGLLKILAEINSSVACDPRLIAQFATLIERDKLSNNIGYQDQYVCSHGGFLLLQFSEVGIRHRKINDIDWLNPYLMLFHTHQYRKRAGDVVSSQLEQMSHHIEDYYALMGTVEQGLKAIEAKDWQWFSRLLHESWVIKKGLSNEITTEAIDRIYDTGLSAGALGGKLLGAGGGGVFLFLVPLDKQEDIKRALPQCEYIPFSFANEGTKIVYRDEEISNRR